MARKLFAIFFLSSPHTRRRLSHRRSPLRPRLRAIQFPPRQAGGGAAELMKDDKQWPMAAKNFANTRFSGLEQINNQNVGELRLAWTFSVGAPRGQEAAPIVVDKDGVCGRALCRRPSR